jgi:hypothetical protein
VQNVRSDELCEAFGVNQSMLCDVQEIAYRKGAYSTFLRIGKRVE